eukprot:8206324-Pyramimonas_sp.AAC.1
MSGLSRDAAAPTSTRERAPQGRKNLLPSPPRPPGQSRPPSARVDLKREVRHYAMTLRKLHVAQCQSHATVTLRYDTTRAQRHSVASQPGAPNTTL